ncbi:MAG: acetylxylan esterase [Deltaproteobacteria bacterium]|nr:acetylxylan esterase [Deltaproteobacteria bacterium]
MKVLGWAKTLGSVVRGPGGVRAVRELLRVNVRDSRVPEFTLPDALTDAAGQPVTTPEGWRARRAEILGIFRHEIYGPAPAGPALVATQLSETSALAGRARCRQIRLSASNEPDRPALHLLLYLPADAPAPAPVFLALNFRGNHSIAGDPSIRLSTAWIEEDDAGGVARNRATEAARGVRSRRWPLETILGRGYGLATAYAGDLAPDHPDLWRTGLVGSDIPADGGALSAWAWGLSRLLDQLECEPGVDPGRVALLGHSRLGKAALWAAAQDERFAVVLANASGCMGAALSRRRFGESLAFMNSAFPHWMAPRLHAYSRKEDALPVDQHQLLTLVAPRPLCISGAEGDRWSDPRGEFLALREASAVYRLLGSPGLDADEWPGSERPILGHLAHHLRRGSHDITARDWAHFLDFADLHIGPQARQRA